MKVRYNSFKGRGLRKTAGTICQKQINTLWTGWIFKNLWDFLQDS